MSSVTRDELKLLVFEVREGLPVDVVKAEAARLLGDVDLAAAVAEDAGLGRRTGLEREAVRLSYPSWMFESFTNDFGPRPAAALAEAMNSRAPMALRVNTPASRARRSRRGSPRSTSSRRRRRFAPAGARAGDARQRLRPLGLSKRASSRS